MDRPTTGRSSVGGVSSAEEPLRDPYERQKPRASEDTSVDRKGRNDGTLRGSNSQQQLPQDLHPVVLLEKNRRIQAEQQVEAQKQVSLELARLLELERQKSKRQARVSTASAGPILRRGSQSSVISTQSVGSILKRRDSQSSGIRKVSQGSWSELENGIEDKIVEEEEEEAEKVDEEATVDIPSPFDSISPRQDNIGQLSDKFLFNNFSSTVFGQLPVDLKKMFRVEEPQENDCDESQPPSELVLAYRAVRTDNPRQLKEHVTALGEAILQSVEGEGLLQEACEYGSDGCVRVLLDSGCHPDTTSREDGMTALHLAASNDHAGCISLLLRWGANPSLSDVDGQTALFFALCEGYRECVDVLLDAPGNSLLTITKMDYTVLHAAVSGNMADILRRLLVYLRTNHDSNTASHIINYRDTDGNTALHLAASRGFQQCVEVLCGCPQIILTVKDRWNRTALNISTSDCRDILMSKDSKEIVVCVQARLPGTQQATPIAIGRATVLRHYKCVDVELLAAQSLEQYCHNLRGHIPTLNPDTETGRNSGDISMTTHSRCSSNENSLELSQQPSKLENHKRERLHSWAERLQRDFCSAQKSTEAKQSPQRTQHSEENDAFSDDLKFLHMSQRRLARMDLGGSSIASYRLGNMTWCPGEMAKQQRGRSLHTVVGDRKGGGLGWIAGGRPTEIHITLKGHATGCLDQLAFELMVPKVVRDKALVLYGPQGCGKTYLAKNVAEFLKHKLGAHRTHVLYVSLHPSFKRDDLFRMLRHNGLLKLTSETNDKDEDTHIVILDDLDRIAGYSIPSILSELLTMLNYRGPLNPTWVDTVYSREGTVLYPAGLYYLKNDSYFIATRTQASGEALPVAVIDRFSHAPLARDGEPCAGVLFRQLLARLIHTRHGDTPHRWDKVYRCVCWVWELWQLYNNYMKQLDLAELSLGLKHVLQCPVESGSSDNIQSWLTQLWMHHIAPRIEETLLHSRRMEGQHHQQTAHLLLRTVVDRAFRPTCPLEMEAAASLLESLYPPTSYLYHPTTTTSSSSSSSGPAFAPSPQRHNHSSRGSDAVRHDTTPTSTSMHTPVTSTCSAPVTYKRQVQVGTLENGSMETEPTHSLPALLHVKVTDTDTASLDRIKLRQTASAKSTLRRLRSKTISLFSRDTGRGGQGEGNEDDKSKDAGATPPPRFFKKRRARTTLPPVSEKETAAASNGRGRAGNAKEMEDFFDMLSVANSNRFNDQRSAAPKPLTQTKEPPPSWTSGPPPNQGAPLAENEDLAIPPSSPSPPKDRKEQLQVNRFPLSLAMSMPDLLSSEMDPPPQLRNNYVHTKRPSGLRVHPEVPQSPGSSLPPHRMQEQRSASLDEPTSEPLRRRVIQREAQFGGEDVSNSPTSSLGQCASPLATTTYVYRRSSRGSSDSGRTDGSEPTMNPLYSPIEETSRELEEGGGEGMAMEGCDSPDGNYPSEVKIGDSGLQKRTYPSGAGVRRHQSARTPPSDHQGGGYKKTYTVGRRGSGGGGEGGGVREGWTTDSVAKDGSPHHQRIAAPLVSERSHPRKPISQADRSHSLDRILETEEARSSHILLDAGLGFLSPHSPIVQGVIRRGSFTGGSPRLGRGRRIQRTPFNEHHEM